MKKFKDVLNEVAPAGWEGTVKAMKKNKDIDNPWALAWYMKNKGYTSHEARQAIKSGFWPQGYKTTDLAIERKKARAEKAERIGKVVDVTTVEDAPANSTADVAMRPTMLFRRKKTSEAVDKDAAKELQLYIENDQKLYRQVESIVKNIQRKMKSGKYDHKKAPKLWMYVVDAGAKQYHKEYGTPGDKWTKMFDKQTRQAVAETMADEYRDEIEAQGGKMF